MRFFLTSLRLELKKVLFSPGALLLLACVAIAMGCAGALSLRDQIATIRVAVVYAESDKTARLIASELPADSGIEFLLLHDEQEARRLVATGAVECAYLLPSDLRASLLSGNTKELVGLIRSPRTLLDVMTNKYVFAAVVRAVAADITVKELAAILDMPENSLRQELQTLYTDYEQNYQFVVTQESWRGGVPEEEDKSFAGARPLYGVLALLLLLCAMTLPSGRAGEEARLRTALPGGKLVAYHLSVFAVFFLRLLLTGSVGLAVLRRVAGEASSFGALAAYALLLAAMALLVSVLPRPTGLFFSVCVFYWLCCLLLGGVLVDPAELGGILTSAALLFPTYWYLRAALGASPVPLVWAAACLLAAAPLIPLARGGAWRRRLRRRTRKALRAR